MPSTGVTLGAGHMRTYIKQIPTIVLSAVFFLQACTAQEDEQQAPVTEIEQEAAAATTAADAIELTITEDSFKCLSEMTAVRHFFVDNLLDDLDATVATAQSPEGGSYPPGSVVQLVPYEVMVKHRPGWNAGTSDWEFFALDVSAEGTSISDRGLTDVLRRTGGTCFGCHIKAEPRYDFICELDRGCDPPPITREQIAVRQSEDPRCIY